MTKIRVLQEDCDPELGDDKSLPYTCYLITYNDKEGNKKYDLAVTFYTGAEILYRTLFWSTDHRPMPQNKFYIKF